jgi:hypothetical protein
LVPCWQYHAQTIANVRAATSGGGQTHCAIMLDTKGPEIRSGKLEGGEVKIEAGTELTLKCGPGPTFIVMLPAVRFRAKKTPGSIAEMLGLHTRPAASE